MRIDTSRFGQVEIDEAKILKFDDGLPGLESYCHFVLLQFEESYPIYWLQSTEDASICLPVIDTFEALTDYAFDLSDSDVKALEIGGPEELHVISVLVIPDSIDGMTVNLAAPIIINMRTNMARQIILGGSDYNVRYPVFHAVCRLIKEGNADVGAVKEAE